MVDINDTTIDQAHLKDALGLYKKISAFNNAVKVICKDVSISKDDISYPSDVVPAVFDAFSSVFDVERQNIEALQESVRLGNIDFTRLSMGEVPAFSLPYHEDELRMIFFIIGRPFFLKLKEAAEKKEKFSDSGRCPVCGAAPSLSYIAGDNRRKLCCSFCGSEGFYKRIGCSYCVNSDTSFLDIMTADEEKDCRIDACKKCGSYIKTFNENFIVKQGADLADILTMPFDIVAQNNGFNRKSPNPLGITKMI